MTNDGEEKKSGCMRVQSNSGEHGMNVSHGSCKLYKKELTQGSWEIKEEVDEGIRGRRTVSFESGFDRGSMVHPRNLTDVLSWQM